MRLFLLLSLLVGLNPLFATDMTDVNTNSPARLVIVIDDLGYRKANELRLLNLPKALNVAILPNAPLTDLMNETAHEKGHDILIHMPMAPINPQSLEVNTLYPDMEEAELNALVDEAKNHVSNAIGLNNHMGSLMTSDLKGMLIVMKRLKQHHLFFLDSVTIHTTEGECSTAINNVPLLKRQLFLDNVQNERAINSQLDQAINMAREHGTVIMIGHPYNETVNVLEKRLHNLPDDIELTAISDLLPTAEAELKIRRHALLNDFWESAKTTVKPLLLQ